jgi:hypothetical protein
MLMKRLARKKRIILGSILLIILVIAAGLYFGRHWKAENYYRLKVERTVTTQIKPLESSLKALGFNDLANLNTDCKYNTYKLNLPKNALNDQLRPSGTYFDCFSGIDRLITVPTDSVGKAAFNKNAEELSKTLQANGWVSRPDYPTIPWFQEISKGVDYQPDQLNEKNVDGMHCIVDFFTAFSKPAPTAISARINCSKNQDG